MTIKSYVFVAFKKQQPGIYHAAQTALGIGYRIHTESIWVDTDKGLQALCWYC